MATFDHVPTSTRGVSLALMEGGTGRVDIVGRKVLKNPKGCMYVWNKENSV